MKKLILMTSALTFVGGAAFAAAHGGGEISISAEASVAYGNWDTSAGASAMSYGTSATATLEGSAGDVSYGGSVTVENADTVSMGEVWISTAYGRFAFEQDGYDATLATGDDGDISYSGSFGDFGLTAVVDADNQAWIFGASTSMAGVNLGAKYDSDGAYEVSGDTTVGGVNIGATFGADAAGANTWEVTGSTTVAGLDVNASYDDAGDWSVGAGATTGGVTWDASYASSGDIAVNASMGFGDTTVSVAYDQGNAGGFGDDAEVVATVTHTVGGLALHAQVNDQQEYELGATASFSF